ncbi:MAG: hypothetical protein QM648_06545 [Solirubrobacterales bacterium]
MTPDLERMTARERAAVRLTAELDVPAPDALKNRVAEMAEARSARRTRGRWIASGIAVTCAALVALALVLTGGGVAGAPTVNDVVAAATGPATMPAPPEDPASPGKLALGVGGVQFPYWGDDHGWTATGARSESVGGRPINTVFYENGDGATIRYSIVSGPPIDQLASADDYEITGSGDQKRIVWRNGGHTCIIEARGVSPDQLEKMAA